MTPVSGSKLGGEFKLPPFFGCGKWLERLQSVILWLGDYETKSVLHNDDVDGMMCLLSGKKRWYYIDKRHYNKVQSKACGWNVADESGRGYGEFVRMKVDNVRPSLHTCYNSTECASSRPPARGMAWRGVACCSPLLPALVVSTLTQFASGADHRGPCTRVDGLGGITRTWKQGIAS